MELIVSLGQMKVIPGEPEANFERVREWTREAAKRGSDIVLFPELWYSGYDLEHWERYAAPLGEGIFARIGDLARENRIAIGGSVLESHGGKVYNTFPLYDAGGNCLAVYRKTHLFTPMNEKRWLAAGDCFEVAETSWGPTGLSICYDLRFPEVYRHCAFGGAKIVLLSAEWPTRRIEHWRLLLQTRAIENQMFVVACNCIGELGEERFGGRSAIIEPWGRTVIEGGDREALLTAEIDLDLVDEARRQFPFLEDSRREIY